MHKKGVNTLKVKVLTSQVKSISKNLVSYE